MMGWNYRTVRRNGIFAIHEVYYANNGRAMYLTENPVSPMGISEGSLIDDLNAMYNALAKPVFVPPKSWGKK